MPYFVRITNRIFGPYNESQLLEMKSKGKMTRHTEVSENKKDWQSAETLGFLFPTGYAASSYPSSGSAPHEPEGRELASWFYSTNGIEGYGPITVSAVRQMIQSGQLHDNSYIWQQGQNARFIKNEPQFAKSFGDSPAAQAAAVAGNKAGEDGYLLEPSKKTDANAVVHPIADSLGWLVFLKIIFLIYTIAAGLGFVWISVALLSRTIGTDSIWVLLVTWLAAILCTCLYGLQFKTFLCLWKYHRDAASVAASGKVSALVQAQRSLCLFWKWLGMTFAAHLTVLLAITAFSFAAGGWRVEGLLLEEPPTEKVSALPSRL